MPEPVSLMIARFPYGRKDESDVTDWLIETVCKVKSDPRINQVFHVKINDTPITMGRNKVFDLALKCGADYLLMVDNDMKPDAYLPTNPNRLESDPSADPFWDAAFTFAYRNEPCVIGAPYCGPPPHENVYVFRWQDLETGGPEDDVSNFNLEQYSRPETLFLSGIQEVAALPTGLILINMDAIRKLEPPYTYYEWGDDRRIEKASTEDVTLTRDLALRGIKQYCAWSSWAGHWKAKCVGRPKTLTSKSVGDKFRAAVLRDYNIGDGEELTNVEGPTDSEGAGGSTRTDEQGQPEGSERNETGTVGGGLVG